jgi:aspartyl-tRNA(Asn)/glutamyl-tRNA(Gln) amidotransferase subunit A
MHRCARLTRPVGYMGLPALAVPCGFSGIGLPLGFQLIGRPFSEARLFTLGHAYQDETGWHEQAPPI